MLHLFRAQGKALPHLGFGLFAVVPIGLAGGANVYHTPVHQAVGKGVG